MHRTVLSLLALLPLGLAACEGPEPPGRGGDDTASSDSGDEGGGGSGGESGDDGGDEGGGDDGGDSGIDGDMCNEVAGYSDVSGAASYFSGELVQSGDSWSGAETWHLYANAAWEAEGGADCKVVWTLEGESVDGGGACATCDFSIAVSATVDSGRTDCSPDLFSGEENYSITYAFDDHGDGTHGMFFAGSGNSLATGELTSSGLTYETEPSCLWF